MDTGQILVPSFSLHFSMNLVYTHRLILVAMLFAGSSVVYGQNSSSDLTSFNWQKAIQSLNKDYLWAPAPRVNPLTGQKLPKNIIAGDEARAVFGQIPMLSCADPSAYTLHIQVNGHQVRLLPNPSNGGQKQFAHFNTRGDIVEWTDTIERCDKPSLAGGVTECGTASRMIIDKSESSPVTWVLLCRKSLNEFEPVEIGLPRTDFGQEKDLNDPDSLYNGRYGDYWAADNPYYALFGLIGFNDITGETTFFDGLKKDWNSYRFDDPVYPPGGFGYRDSAFRADEASKPEEESFYTNEHTIKCHTCHDNSNPWILSPHTNFKEVGYINKSRRELFSSGPFTDLQSYNSEFRIIGTDYINQIDPQRREGYELLTRAKSFTLDPGCSQCHNLTTQMSGRYFAYDSLGLINQQPPPSHIYDDPEGIEWYLQWEFLKNSRSRWATDVGKVHPWMPLPLVSSGKFIDPAPADLYDRAPQALKVLQEQLDLCAHPELHLPDQDISSCNYKPLYSECPTPELEIDKVSLAFEAQESSQRITWQYKNDYGEVPDRDDVRFDAVLQQVSLSDPTAVTASAVYPGVEPQQSEFLGNVLTAGVDGALARLYNVSPANQPIYTDPAPTDQPRQFALELPPLQCGYKYVASIKAKRFCFDTQPEKLSVSQATTSLELPCN